MDVTPPLLGEPLHGKSGQLDGDEKPEGDDPHGDRRGSPRARERDQKVPKAEGCVAVNEQGDQVTDNEEEGESGEPAMHAEEPRCSACIAGSPDSPSSSLSVTWSPCSLTATH